MSVILDHNSVQTDWEIFCRCSLLNFDIIRRLFYNLQHICIALDHRWMNWAKGVKWADVIIYELTGMQRS